jgi:AcrR family transcriptional regulator
MVETSSKTGNSRSSEAAVLAAAEDVFVRRGYDGARMQEIADVAGINKAMLHYYFRSKERLFQEVFRSILDRTLAPLVEALGSEFPLGVKIRHFVDGYIDALDGSPALPSFILSELNRDRSSFDAFIRDKASVMPPVLQRQIDEAVSSGRIRPIRAEELVAVLLSLCIFPYAARPLLEPLCGMDDEAYRAFLASRKSFITSFAFSALRPGA